MERPPFLLSPNSHSLHPPPPHPFSNHGPVSVARLPFLLSVSRASLPVPANERGGGRSQIRRQKKSWVSSYIFSRDYKRFSGKDFSCSCLINDHEARSRLLRRRPFVEFLPKFLMLVGAKINIILFLRLRFENIRLGDVQFV